MRSGVARLTFLPLVVVLLLAIVGPSGARADASSVFFGGWYEDAIGKVGADGSNPEPKFIPDDAIAQALTVEGDYLYWQANSFPLRIGRSRLDGSEIQPEFIEGGVGHIEVAGLSVSGGRLYWAETRSSSGLGSSTLSSTNLDGSDRVNGLLSLGPNAEGPVVVTHGFVFFVGETSSQGITHWSIVRRRLGGRGRSTIASNRPLVGDTLVALGDYVYWVEDEDRATFIARASLDGGSINTRFRRVPNRGCHSHSAMNGGAISGRYYFIGCESGRIDRISMSGKPHLRQLHTGADLSSGPVLAVVPD
jgi:hypothetical protein